MSKDPRNLAALLDIQMRSTPIRNDAAQITASTPEKTHISIPLRHRPLARLLKHVLPLSSAKNLELDALGMELYALCDGQHTVEQMVDLHCEKWNLSFFEARAMVLSYLRQLLQRNLILVLRPQGDDRAEGQ